jgi:hypothetical protein
MPRRRNAVTDRSYRRSVEWALDLDIREDEDSAWIPTTDLPGGAPGDGVTVRSEHLATERRGTIVETVDDASRGAFHRVVF